MSPNPLVEDLELRTNNPYSVGSVFIFPEGDFLLDRDPIVVEKSIGDKYHTVIEGEILSQISFIEYGNSKYWWLIYDTNDIDNPFDLESGTILLIPDLNKVEATT